MDHLFYAIVNSKNRFAVRTRFGNKVMCWKDPKQAENYLQLYGDFYTDCKVSCFRLSEFPKNRSGKPNIQIIGD